jgi:hypothetical protein
MIDSDGSIAARLQAAADEIIRLVAPDDCQPESPSLALPFAALGIGEDLGIHGFAAVGLDVFAARRFDNPTFRGRPVFALNFGKIAARHGSEVESLELAREVALHELAHSVIKGTVETINDDFIERIVAEFQSPNHVPFAPTLHGPGWWRRFTTLVARAMTAAPTLAPAREYVSTVQAYGYGAVTPAKWLAAATMTPDFMTGQIAEVASRSAPWFDELLAQVVPASTSAPAVAATSS